MKKTLAIFAILLMAFSSLAFAEGEEAAPEAPSEPAPSETPSEPEAPPSEPAEAPPSEPNLPPALPPGELTGDQQPPQGEQPVPTQVPGGPGGEPGSGGQGGNMPPQNGPGNGGCWVGEQQVPCPGEGQQNEGRQPQQQPGTNFMNPQNIPQGCKQENNNGMINIVCDNAQRQVPQFDCTPGPQREEIEKKCKETGGRIVVKNIVQSKGCGIVDCVFGGASEGNFMPGQQQTCPGPDELAKQEENCKSMGLNPKRMRSNCEFVQCEDPNKQQTMCPDVSLERMNAKEQCQNGGKVVDEFDNYGCPVPKCISSGESCSSNVPQEAYFKCEDKGGKLVVNSDENGCISFSKCVMQGQEGVHAEDTLDEVPPAAKLLQVALKLESIKISFDQMSKQISAIADYYDNEGDSANAERFRTAAGMFESAKKQIDGVKEELKMGINGMSVEQIIDIKHKIRQISDVVMEDALYVILGGESTGTYESAADETAYEPGEGVNCGTDGNCFGKALRICQKGSHFSPQDGAMVKVVGLDNGVCLLQGKASTSEGEKELSCKFADYATDQLTIDNVMQYCEGSMVEYMKQNTGEFVAAQKIQNTLNPEQAFQGQMMGCEKVDKGINKQGVCGNECCENRFGESNYNCPQDCMAPQQQQAGSKLQQPMYQKVQQVFKQEGAGGCEDEMSGQSPKDVCGNECCEPGESPENCPKDCNAMQRQPLSDNGQFFNEQRGPAPAGQEGQYNGEQIQGVEQMPREERIAPQEFESAPVEEQPVTEERPAAEEPAATETSSGGEGGIVTGAYVAIDLLKEFLGR